MRINKFVIGGILILGAVVFLIWTSTAQSAEYFYTIDELNAKGSGAVDRNLRVSGAVLGDSIQYDAQNLTLSFEVAHVPADNLAIETEGGLAEVSAPGCPRSNALPDQSRLCGSQTRPFTQ